MSVVSAGIILKLPRAILFDLDDTMVVAFGPAQSQWQRTIAAFADRLGPIEARTVAAVIQAASSELWGEPARHKYWRHRTGEARRRIVANAFAALATAGSTPRGKQWARAARGKTHGLAVEMGMTV
jgi:putative hydrolase of the HAD superfamily